jgi:hypothetical protein
MTISNKSAVILLINKFPVFYGKQLLYLLEAITCPEPHEFSREE